MYFEHFQHIFQWKFPLYNTVSIDQVSASDILYFSRYWFVFINACLDTWYVSFRIYLQSSCPINSAVVDRGMRTAREKYKKLNISRTNIFSKKKPAWGTEQFLSAWLVMITWGRFLPGRGHEWMHHKFENFPQLWWNIQVFEIWEDAPLRLILKDKFGNQHYVALPFCWSWTGVWDILWKRGGGATK